MTTQIQKLIELVKENPELPVRMLTGYEVIGDGYGYWLGSIENIVVDYFYFCPERERYFTGREEIEEALVEEVPEEYSLEEAEKIAKYKFNDLEKQGKIYKAIIVYIGLPEE